MSSSSSLTSQDRAIVDTYVKFEQVEHVLKRPDTYVGGVEQTEEKGWIWSPSKNRMEFRTYSYIPGLFKIFDEILVNAADNRQRDWEMDTLSVWIDEDTNSIEISNNGQCIPVRKHPTYGCYVPEFIFGLLLTSSNFDDSVARLTGGRNGYGSKLTNIFSKKFNVQVWDTVNGKYFSLTWTDNMSKKGVAEVLPLKDNDKDNKVIIKFTPDLKLLGKGIIKQLKGTDDLLLMQKRVMDVVGASYLHKGTSDKKVKNLKVSLNGKRIDTTITSFKKYMELYLSNGEEHSEAESKGKSKENKKKGKKEESESESSSDSSSSEEDEVNHIVYHYGSNRWELGVAITDGQTAKQVSFVNSISTSKGGTHIEYIRNQLVKYIQEYMKKKHKTEVKRVTVINHLFLFLNCLIVNPSFDTQTKETLKTAVNKFGSTCELDDKWMKKIMDETDLVKSLLHHAKFDSEKKLKRKDGKKSRRVLGIPKLEDANLAGSKDSSECTIILCEGDSAKALVVAGIHVMGRANYGVYPLKGKLPNVRSKEKSTSMEKEILANIIKIIGLKQGEKYKNTSSLRYGHVMIMTDQDHDGSHIKGLIINMFECWWPELLDIPDFLQEFITPIVKAKPKPGAPKSNAKRETLSFFTIPEFEQWKASQTVDTLKHYTVKYYKGLGTSTNDEAVEYFSDLVGHVKSFYRKDKKCADALATAFNNDSNGRKDWTGNCAPGTFLDHTPKKISYQDFVDKELILFSVASNIRAIPCFIDGNKPTQRKILFTCFIRNLIYEIKLAQLGGSVGEKTAYHHGEKSLTDTATNLGQSYVGSNNINLLHPAGQFGTRHNNGKDHASARYIFTHLTSMARLIFKPEDDDLLNYLDDNGLSIEPEWYIPVIPMVLVNGANGTGTGWATFIPNYNPVDIVGNILNWLDGKPLQSMIPWYRGFMGAIVPQQSNNNFISYGRAEFVDEDTMLITELPIGFHSVSTTKYKEHLEKLILSKKIVKFKENHTSDRVHFTIKCNQTNRNILKDPYKSFKLSVFIHTTTMVVMNIEGKPQKYEKPEDLIQDFCPIRLLFYHKRKELRLKNMIESIEKLQNEMRFVEASRSGQFKSNRPRKIILEQLIGDKYKQIPKGKKIKLEPAASKQKSKIKISIEEEEEEEEKVEDEVLHDVPISHYFYLLLLPNYDMNDENTASRKMELDVKKIALEKAKLLTPEGEWRQDLSAILKANENIQKMESDTFDEKGHKIKSKKGAVLPSGKYIPHPVSVIKVSSPHVEEEEKETMMEDDENMYVGGNESFSDTEVMNMTISISDKEKEQPSVVKSKQSQMPLFPNLSLVNRLYTKSNDSNVESKKKSIPKPKSGKGDKSKSKHKRKITSNSVSRKGGSEKKGIRKKTKVLTSNKKTSKNKPLKKKGRKESDSGSDSDSGRDSTNGSDSDDNSSSDESMDIDFK